MNNNNTTYKDSPLGKIPVDWEEKTLGQLFDFKNGINASKSSYGIGVKFINVMEIIYHNSLTSDMIPGNVKISDKQIRDFLVKRGDVLFNRTSETTEEIGLAAVYLGDEEVVFGGFVIRGVPKDNTLDDEYKKYCFYSDSVRYQIIKGGQGAIRSNIGQGDLEKVKLITPPLPEQKAIAHVLGLIDSAINSNNQLIAQKELQKKWLMQQLLSEKLIVKNEKWCKSGVRKVTIGEISEVNMGQSPDSSYYNEIGEGLPLIQGNADLKSRLSIERIYTTQLTKTCDQGDIIMTVRAPVGAIGIASKNSCIGRGVCALKPINIDSSYFYYLMLNYEETWKRLEQGSTFTAVNSSDIFHFSLFIINSPEEQAAIAEVLQSADKEIQLLKSKTEKLRGQKKGLMQVLLTGRKRLRI
jgi:type I restriction enzyme S subunit